jgi:iron complex transport system substrate-binding protein
MRTPPPVAARLVLPLLLLGLFPRGPERGLAAEKIVLTDDLGRTVTLPGPARRIVSLAPSLTESLFAIGAGAAVVGRTAFCDYPAEALKVAEVGGMTNPSIEQVVALSPDLVVVSMEGNLREDVRRLNGLGIPVYVSNPRTLGGIYHSLEHLARLSGRAAEGGRLVDSLRSRERLLEGKIPALHPSVLLFVSLHPLMAAGANTLLDDLLRRAGGTNVGATLRGHYPAISREAVLARDPEVILCTSEIMSGPEELLTLFPEWAQLQAVRRGKVVSIDADVISRPGPRALQGLALLITALHGTTP